MKLYLVEGHDVVAIPQCVYQRLREIVPPEYDIVAAHEKIGGGLVAWCCRPSSGDTLKFAENVITDDS